ncbi:MAG: cytochrome [Candidatus Moranbacteria bacterium CG_4_10_14_3_um_filter_45_9]|nr:MAG: cytochrome [Candidatus Moranbacteria bacterium CG_4_10_14_3_um_filter_45_9]
MPQWKDDTKPHGPIKMNNGWTVEVDANACIGAAPCTAMAPNTFALNDDGKAGVLATLDQDDQEIILNAARSCPVAAIIIKDETGKVIFPE